MGVSLPIPKIIYRPVLFTVDSSNNKIDFIETGTTELTATLTAGTYTIGGMQALIKRALDAAGASTYTVVYNLSGASQNKFTFTSDGVGGGGIFSLTWATGSHTATSAKTLLGFANSNQTAALTYTAGSASPTTVTLTFDEDLRAPTFALKRAGAETVASVGVKQVTMQRVDVMYGFKIKFSTRATFDSWVTFLSTCALWGAQFDFYPKTGTSTWVNFTLDGESWSGAPMPELFQHFTFDLKFREVLPEESVNTPAGRGSRASILTNRLQWM